MCNCTNYCCPCAFLSGCQVEITTGLPMIYDFRTKRIRLLDDGMVSICGALYVCMYYMCVCTVFMYSVCMYSVCIYSVCMFVLCVCSIYCIRLLDGRVSVCTLYCTIYDILVYHDVCAAYRTASMFAHYAREIIMLLLVIIMMSI